MARRVWCHDHSGLWRGRQALLFGKAYQYFRDWEVPYLQELPLAQFRALRFTQGPFTDPHTGQQYGLVGTHRGYFCNEEPTMITTSPFDMLTGRGHVQNLDFPTPTVIELEDIALSLARQPRWLGHTRRFFSVASHCLLASAIAEHQRGEKTPAALHALLRDAHEAYLGHLTRPFKQLWAHRYNPTQRRQDALEQIVQLHQDVIYGGLGLLPPTADLEALATYHSRTARAIEARHLLPESPFRNEIVTPDYEAPNGFAEWVLRDIHANPREIADEFVRTYLRLESTCPRRT